MDDEWMPELEIQRIAEGSYNGYLGHFVETLRAKLPLPLPDKADLWQDFVGYALEAVEMYDPNNKKGAKFGTFLYKHLSIRSMQWFNYCWMPCNHPTGRWVWNFSLLTSKDDEQFDPLDSKQIAREWREKVEDLIDHLTPRAKQLYNYFIEYMEWENSKRFNDFQKALADENRSSAIAKLTGLQEREVRAFFAECKQTVNKLLEV